MEFLIKRLSLIFIVLVALTSCKPDPTLSLSASSLEVISNGSESSVTITSNTSWRISGGDGWCSAVPSAGEGNATVKLLAAKNSTNAPRSTTMTVIAESLSGSLIVNQKQNDALILTKKTENLDNNARTISVELKSNIQYSVTIPVGVDWITKVASKSFDTFTHEFSIGRNISYDNRSAIIIFKDLSSNLADTLTINQAQTNALILTSKVVDLSSEGGSVNVELRSNISYDVLISSGDNWVAHLGTKGLTPYTHQLFVSKNSTFDSRSAKVIFKERNGTLSDTLIVNQQMLAAIFVSKENFYIQKGGGSFNYSTQSNVGFNVTISGGTGWVTQIQTKGLVTTEYTFSVGPNTGSTDRSAKIIFTQSGQSLADTVNIKQTGFDGYYVYVENSQTLGSLVPVADRAAITNLKIEGYLKAADFTTIRENLKAVKYLDISGAKLENDKIPDYAFKSTPASPSVLETIVFPSNLFTIGKEAFYNCLKITSLNLPNSIVTIDDYAFMSCNNLAGHLELPVNLNALGTYAFANCIGLTSVRLQSSLRTIGNFAFAYSTALKKVYTKIDQPYAVTDVFNGISTNADLIVPVGRVNAYQLTVGWAYNFFARIYEEGTSPDVYITTTEKAISSTGYGDTKSITIQATDPWVVESKPGWVTLSQSSGTGSGTIQVKFDSYSNATLREGNLVLKLTGTTTKATVLLQQTNLTFEDGDYVKLQSATQGNGVNLVFMGDGYSIADMNSKKYENNIREAVTAFFAVEPYKTYVSYFNVYMVYAFSPESGISDLTKTVRTTFETMYTKAPPSTSMSTNTTTCFTYALKAPITDINKSLVVLIANSTRYAGTCWMYSTGAAVAICPLSGSSYPYDFRGVVEHEAGGHGFGKLADEYVNTQGLIIQSQINNLKTWQGYGHYLNVDVTADPANILWKHFIGISNYSYVGAYEGGYYYSQGVWRPEQSSAMINNIKYFNAPSRELIVKRIKSIAGMTYSFDDFKARDVMEFSAATKAAAITIDPSMLLAPPVMIQGGPK